MLLWFSLGRIWTESLALRSATLTTVLAAFCAAASAQAAQLGLFSSIRVHWHQINWSNRLSVFSYHLINIFAMSLWDRTRVQLLRKHLLQPPDHPLSQLALIRSLLFILFWSPIWSLHENVGALNPVKKRGEIKVLFAAKILIKTLKKYLCWSVVHSRSDLQGQAHSFLSRSLCSLSLSLSHTHPHTLTHLLL